MLRHMATVYAVACPERPIIGHSGSESKGEWAMKVRRRANRGGGRLLLTLAAIGGVATAFFADPARGMERRQAALDRLADLRELLGGRGRSKLPQMTTISAASQPAPSEPALQPREG